MKIVTILNNFSLWIYIGIHYYINVLFRDFLSILQNLTNQKRIRYMVPEPKTLFAKVGGIWGSTCQLYELARVNSKTWHCTVSTPLRQCQIRSIYSVLNSSALLCINCFHRSPNIPRLDPTRCQLEKNTLDLNRGIFDPDQVGGITSKV